MNGSAYDLVFQPLEFAGLHKLRAQLLSHAHGKTLEIGIGTGLNLPHYPPDVELTGVEPDDSMRKKAMKRVSPLKARITADSAMALPFHDNEFDTVVGTLVLCTIPDPALAVREVYRVLKPGGTFLLLEHVRKNTPAAGKILDLLTPLWTHLADGCHLNRDPSPLIDDAGFRTEEYKTLWTGLGKLWVLKK
ncbi:MAG TPA: methyltransferase domain-containing protein [Bacteriovoracaceae bacterium]|nr:methyltransferase domain-containing protein [Bacteriovoracaceae bacterium]